MGWPSMCYYTAGTLEPALSERDFLNRSDDFFGQLMNCAGKIFGDQ